MVLGFGGPTKGIIIIWVHFVILVGCELVTLKLQIMLIYRPAAAGGGLLIAAYLFKISLFSGKFKVLKIKRMHISHISFSTISIDLTGNASTISRFKMPTTNFCEIRQ